MATLISPHIIAKEALIVLENNLVMGGLVYRDFSKEYQRVGATVSIRKPATFSSTAVTSTINLNTVTESSVDVVLDKHIDVTVYITSQEMSLNIVDFSEQILQPMMRAHAQTIDAYLMALYADVAGHYAVNATPAVSDITGVRSVMNVLKVPMQDRRSVMHPVTESAYLPLASFLNAEKRGDTQAIKDASMGRVLGIEHYMDQNVRTHTTGGYAAAASVVVIGTVGTVGGTQLKLINGVASGTVNTGDVFKVGGYDQWHVITAPATANATNGTCTVSFLPALISADAAAATVTFQQSHRANLAFHKNAFALVTAPLEPPLGGAQAAVLNFKGLSARVVYGYTMMEKYNIISMDILLGVKTLDQNLAARLCDAR